VPQIARALFDVAVDYILSSRESIKFWKDRWLQGRTLAEIAPNLYNLVPKRVVKTRTVAKALVNRGWVADIRGALSVQVLVEYLQVWDLVDGLILQQDTPDQFRWSSHNPVPTPASQHMLPCFWEPSNFLPGKEFGRVGLL